MTTSIPIKDGAGGVDQLAFESGASGLFPWSQPIANGALVSDTAPFPIKAPSAIPVTGPAVSPQPAGVGSIQAQGSSQTLFVAGACRFGYRIQNPSTATESLFASDCGAAGPNQTGSIEIEPGMLYESPYPPLGAVTIYGATTGHVFFAACY